MYDQLDSGLQQVISFNHSYLSNIYFLGFVFIISCFYILYYKKNMEQKTTSLFIGVLRLVFTVISFITLFITPYFMHILNPATQTNAILDFYHIIYWSFIGLGGILVLVDVVHYLPLIAFKIMGLNLDDPDTNKLYKDFLKELNKLPGMKFKNGKKNFL